MQSINRGPVIAVSSLQEFFRDAFHSAAVHQRLKIDESVEAYVVSLLTLFSRVEALFDRTPEGPRLRPLALMLALTALDPRSMQPLYSTVGGWTVLGCIALLETTGWLLIRRIMAIDV